jgi:curved DNA-binding protein CbpA
VTQTHNVKKKKYRTVQYSYTKNLAIEHTNTKIHITMEVEDDPYEILGLNTTTASPAEIAAAYKRLCRKFHPDKAKDEPQRQEFTQRMYKINHAKEVLMDPQEFRQWKEHQSNHRSRRRQEEDGSHDPSHDDNGKEEDDEDDPNPARGNLGTPYNGKMGTTMSTFTFCHDGSHGHDARDGVRGLNGFRAGSSGGNGTHAGPAGRGQPGSDVQITLDVRKNADNHFVVRVVSHSGLEVVNPLRNQSDGYIPLKLFGKVDWSSRGGNGGRGGKGGDGGHGQKGYRGRDASRYHRGTDGGPGGHGGGKNYVL